MGYIAKIYVSEVMDFAVVSGYVIDTDPISNPDHEAVEFTYQTTALRPDDPLEWLQTALWLWYRDMRTPARVEA